MIRLVPLWLVASLIASVLILASSSHEVASENESDQAKVQRSAIAALGLVRHLERQRDRTALRPAPGTMELPTGPEELAVARKAEGLRTADFVKRLLVASSVRFDRADMRALDEFINSPVGRKLVALVAARDRMWEAEEREVRSATRRLLLHRKLGPRLRRAQAGD